MLVGHEMWLLITAAIGIAYAFGYTLFLYRAALRDVRNFGASQTIQLARVIMWERLSDRDPFAIAHLICWTLCPVLFWLSLHLNRP